MFNLLELPPELKERIFVHCSGTDLLNVGCCSSATFECVEYVLWKSVRIPWTALKKIHFPTLSNLKFATRLTLYENKDRGGYKEEEECKHKVNSHVWLNISTNYSKILNYCTPAKVTQLNISGVATNPEIKKTVDCLVNLEELALAGTNFLFDTNWRYLNSLKLLRKLSLQKCGIDDNGVRDVTNCCCLEEVYFKGCCLMRDPSLRHITTTLGNLKKFTLIDHAYISAHALRYLSHLHHLTSLHLESTCINDETLIHLCEHLKKLRLLNVSASSQITDHGFTRINLLTSLVELSIVRCWDITDSCFTSIKDLQMLERIAFTAYNMCDTVFFNLLKMSRLKQVKMMDMDYYFWYNSLNTYCNLSSMRKHWYDAVGPGRRYQTVMLKKELRPVHF